MRNRASDIVLGLLFFGTLIGLYVIKEAVEILGDARRARTESTPPTA